MESDSFRLSPSTACQRHSDLRLGLTSLVKSFLAVVGIQHLPKNDPLNTPVRRAQGLVLVFPGIEGHSEINQSIVRGLVAADLPYAIQIQQWCRFSFWNPFHLTMEHHNRMAASRIAELIRCYHHTVPDRPIHLIGHSAGAGMVLFVLEALSQESALRKPLVDSAVLLAAAVSRRYSMERSLNATRSGIWNISSPLDVFASICGTCIFGTMDRRHEISIGAVGVDSSGRQTKLPDGRADHRAPGVVEIRYSPGMIKSWNLGGHFGCTNSVFVKRHVAPILKPSSTTLHQS